MEIIKVKISKVKPNNENPRIIKDHKFHKLVDSIKEFPEMLKIRPIVVNSEMVVLGGNMRLRACNEAKLKEVYILIADNLTKQQEQEFIVKDNVGFGEWDWDILANNWDNELLKDWGMDVWQTSEDDVNLDNFFEEKPNEENLDNNELTTLILNYTEDDYSVVVDAFNKLSGTKEEIVFNLLTK